MKTLQISESKARSLYHSASPEFKQTLEDTFGKEFFSKSVTERVKTYEDACAEIGEAPIDEDKMKAAGFTDDEITYRKLKTITKALNEGTEFDIYDSSINRWYPYFSCGGSPSGFAFDDADYGSSSACGGSGSRLCFKSEALAEYVGQQFTELYRKFLSNE